jgi:AraC-like DNA-binding protein
MHSMTTRDMCAEIAALLNPLPVPESDEEAAEIPFGQLEEELEEQAASMRVAWEDGGVDPLLSSLEHLRQRRLRLEADMRLLIAYGRRFTHPRPYKLIDLANAAGMSISGVRTAYDDEEVDQAAQILGRRPIQPATGEG